MLELNSPSRIRTTVATISLTTILTAWIEEKLPLGSGLMRGWIDGWVWFDDTQNLQEKLTWKS